MKIQRQARRVVPATRHAPARVKQLRTVTVGDLIAAAYDTAGDAAAVKKLLSSDEFAGGSGVRFRFD